jgi:hypothetical protein
MYPKVSVLKEIDEFTKEEYEFILFGNLDLVLDEYILTQRITKRHKFNKVKYYNRIRSKDSTMLVEEVPLTDEIVKKAIDDVISRLKVIKSK